MARPLTTEPAVPLASFDDLYREFAGQVFAWARRYAGGRTGWAEDVTHDVFVRAWLHRDELRAGDVKRWLFRVTQNRAFTLLRREGTITGRLRQAVHLAWQGEAPATPEIYARGQPSMRHFVSPLRGFHYVRQLLRHQVKQC